MPLGAPNPFNIVNNDDNKNSGKRQKRQQQQQQQQPAVETLYIADTLLGLTRIPNLNDPKSKLEIVVRSVEIPDPNNLNLTLSSPILYADDVAIGPNTGRVYFTDASNIVPDQVTERWNRHHRNTKHWDTLYASKIDLVRGVPTGRLLQYDPANDETIVLLDHLHFANGVAVTADEHYVIVAETFGTNLLRYDLRDGTVTTLVSGEQLPGYVDGIDCAWNMNNNNDSNINSNSMCYAVMPSAIVPLHKLWNALPGPLAHLLRTVAMILPRILVPPVKAFGGVIEFDPTGATTTTTTTATVTRTFLDPTGRDISMLTGVTVGPDGNLYLGSLHNKFVGMYELD